MVNKLTGHTITIERIGNIPELDRVWRIDDFDQRIIERLDGVLVRHHGTGHGVNMLWDDARFLAERVEATYIGPGRPETLPVREVRAGWWVLVGDAFNSRWHRVKAVTEVVNLDQSPGSDRHPKIRIEFHHRLPIRVTRDELFSCRWQVGKQAN